MKTKNDYWRNILYAYCFIIIGLILLFFRINTLPEIPQLFGVLIFSGIGMYFLIKAVRIYQELEDKNIYPSQLDFLNNRIGFQLRKKGLTLEEAENEIVNNTIIDFNLQK